MSSSLSFTVVLYALALAVICLLNAISGRPRPPVISVAFVVLECAVLAQAAFDVVALLRGKHDAEVATNIGYLLTSAAVLPVTAAAAGRDPGRWASVALTCGCVLVVVVSIRMHQTLGSADV